MSYEINNNTYTTKQPVKAHDAFNHKITTIRAGTDIDSVWASWIIVKQEEYEAFEDLTPQQGIDKRIELGYIELKV